MFSSQLLVFSLPLKPSACYGLLVSWGFLITHNDAPQSVVLLWTSDQLVAETSTWQHKQTNINASGGIRTHESSRRAAVDLRHRPRVHWDRRFFWVVIHIYTVSLVCDVMICRINEWIFQNWHFRKLRILYWWQSPLFSLTLPQSWC
jgi:hypothetical protein